MKKQSTNNLADEEEDAKSNELPENAMFKDFVKQRLSQADVFKFQSEFLLDASISQHDARQDYLFLLLHVLPVVINSEKKLGEDKLHNDRNS